MHPHEAVLRIWESRSEAAQKQAALGRTDAGLRSEVTGGGHMDALTTLIADAFLEAGLGVGNIWFRRSNLELPGFFRAEKKWDIVVVAEGRLLAAVELKCIASSYGNNMNNRAEEALGNAVDLGHAIKNGLVGSYAPWLGYVFVIRDEAGSRGPVKVKEPHFNVDLPYRGASYQERARLLCARLVMERLYDKAWFVTADPDTGTVQEPDDSMTWAKFKAAIRGKVGEFLA